MDTNKEIERMAEIIFAGWENLRPDKRKDGFRESLLKMMKEEDLRFLVEAGYRPAAEVEKEVATKLLRELSKNLNANGQYPRYEMSIERFEVLKQLFGVEEL